MGRPRLGGFGKRITRAAIALRAFATESGEPVALTNRSVAGLSAGGHDRLQATFLAGLRCCVAHTDDSRCVPGALHC